MQNGRPGGDEGLEGSPSLEGVEARPRVLRGKRTDLGY